VTIDLNASWAPCSYSRPRTIAPIPAEQGTGVPFAGLTHPVGTLRADAGPPPRGLPV
jgi:hypothetical protein